MGRSPVKKRSKYGSVGTYEDGIYFRSKAELARYRVLKEREKRGAIHDLKCQPRYKIAHPETGEKVCTYVADFSYLNATYNAVVEDVKGMVTETYALKKNLVRIFLGIHIVEVKPYRGKWKLDGEIEQ